MDEASEAKKEETDRGLTTAALAGVGARPQVRPVATSSFDVGGASSAAAATAPAINEQAAPLFSPVEAKDFRARWDEIQVSFVDAPREVWCSRPAVLSQWR